MSKIYGLIESDFGIQENIFKVQCVTSLSIGITLVNGINEIVSMGESTNVF